MTSSASRTSVTCLCEKQTFRAQALVASVCVCGGKGVGEAGLCVCVFVCACVYVCVCGRKGEAGVQVFLCAFHKRLHLSVSVYLTAICMHMCETYVCLCSLDSDLHLCGCMCAAAHFCLVYNTGS